MIVMTVIGAVLRPFARQRRWRSSVTRGAIRESSGKRSEDGDDDRRGEHRADCINHHARRPVGIRRAELGPDHRHLHRALVEASRRSRDRSVGSARQSASGVERSSRTLGRHGLGNRLIRRASCRRLSRSTWWAASNVSGDGVGPVKVSVRSSDHPGLNIGAGSTTTTMP